MRNIFGDGSNLPPGCSVNDIPGNRPEDEAWEKITTDFWEGEHCSDELWKKFSDVKLDSDLMDIVDKAIEYGMELGRQEQLATEKEADHYAIKWLREEISNALDMFEKGETNG